MALASRSLILYGLEVTTLNRSIDFKISGGGSTLLATLNLGFYSLTDLCAEIVRAMQVSDPAHTYAASVNRNVNGGLENRVTLSTSGSFLSLLFSSGPRTASTVAPLIGFNTADYTGSTSYTGITSAGIPLIPDIRGYNYLGPEFNQKVFGNVTVSASGLKQAVVFQVQEFIQVEYKYESKSKVISQWLPFFQWGMEQKGFDFTPEITSPSVFYNVTLEKTEADGKGLAFKFTEMLPQFPDIYRTGLITMRLNPS